MMFDFVPLPYYSFIYYNVILIFVVTTLFHTVLYSGVTKKTYLFSKVFGIVLFLFVLLYMGLRPVSWYFGDMGNYAKKFDMYVHGWRLNKAYDIGFYSLMRGMSYFESKTLFFFTIALLYVAPLYVASKRLFKRYYYFAFLMFVSSFEFWSYGTNGIRNGLATSLIILAFAYMNKKWIMYLLFAVAYSIHSSVLIPITAYFITSYYKKSSKPYFMIWFASIFLSLFIGNTIENFIISLGIMREDIVMTYFVNKDVYASSFSHTGFRWDFLLYSSLGVIVGYYFLFIKKMKDKYYSQLVNIYLLSNAAWILVINASFSNRFAYLSWFMMALVIIYPFLKQIHGKKQFLIVGIVILCYFSFSYMMNFILLVV